MNTDRSVEELLELFDVKNISQLGSDIIREFFDDISYKEVMKLCRVNRQFNIICNKESMWKQKVKNDYGITKILYSTWKETARLLFESNMINLNANWVNNKTYRELFEEGLESKNDQYFYDLYNNIGLLPIVFPNYVHNIETAKKYVANDYKSESDLDIEWDEMPEEERYIAFNQEYNNILQHEDMLNIQITAMTREFSVVAHAVSEIRGLNLDNDFGLAQRASDMSQRNLMDEDTGEPFLIIKSDLGQERMNRRLARLIDPMLYVITYCLMSVKNLRRIDIWL
uniref:F-box domain-containing protein n=1 Tax=Pithovirus LCPAC403 TaxID=2506596 RepID=A0A481ZC82_9VIRU|nr:MAG: uncharacterized protein LCPAC403_02190 [Pithovirus LCPAC403]